jgi:hypothetical protein
MSCNAESSIIFQILRWSQLHAAVNASSPQSYVHARCSRLSRQYAGVAPEYTSEHIPPHSCQPKVLLALANDIIQQPLLGTKLLCAFASVLLIIAAIVNSLLTAFFPQKDHCHVRMSVSYQQPLKPTVRSIRSPPEFASNLAISETMP